MDQRTLTNVDRVNKILYTNNILSRVSPDSSGVALVTKNMSIGFYYLRHRNNMGYYFIAPSIGNGAPSEYFRDFRLLHKRVLELVKKGTLT